jgi:hypothetical protein
MRVFFLIAAVAALATPAMARASLTPDAFQCRANPSASPLFMDYDRSSGEITVGAMDDHGSMYGVMTPVGFESTGARSDGTEAYVMTFDTGTSRLSIYPWTPTAEERAALDAGQTRAAQPALLARFRSKMTNPIVLTCKRGSN